MPEYIQVITTVEKAADAERIAQTLVEERLAACVQIAGPVTSIYRWQGKIEKAQEWRCVCKTRNELYEKVEAAIRSLHPYEVPEIIAVPIVTGGKDYLDWLNNEIIQ